MSRSAFAIVVLTLLAVVSLYQHRACAAEDEIATTFTYTDPTATTVGVAGEFSNWKIISMVKDDSGKWTKTLYLKPGSYGYKLVVDGDWRLDPNNAVHRAVNDVENSAITVGDAPPATPAGSPAITFGYSNPNAKTVHVAGDFNRWLDNTGGKVTGKTEWQMQNDGAGNWKFTTQLPPGRYKFKYAIDGGEKWEQDSVLPASPDGNSIIEVKGQVQTSASLAPTAPAATTSGAMFTYADPTAKAVFLAGQFNNWSPTATPLRKDELGLWTVTVPLKPGRYQYKFVADGDWRTDPTISDSADDGMGGKNSVKTVQ